jgi:hypothetical protein
MIRGKAETSNFRSGTVAAESLLRPDREFAGAGRFEMKSATAGKIEDCTGDRTAQALYFLQAALQLRPIENDLWSRRCRGPCLLRPEETAGCPSIIIGGVIRPVILKRPREERGKKFLRCREIA